MGYKGKVDILDQLREANTDRVEVFGHTLQEWSLTDWGCAVAGETGELCNFIKKKHRGDQVDDKDIAREAADIVIYLDLLCQRAGLNLRSAIVDKFNEKSKQMSSKIELKNYSIEKVREFILELDK